MMKKNILRIMCAILSVMMVLALFTGCQDTKIDNNDENETESAAPKQVLVLDGISINWGGSNSSYTVGKNMTINEFGQLSEVSKRSETINFEYNTDGLITKINITDKNDGTVGYETWTYEGKDPVEYEYEPNDGFHSSRKATIEITKDAEGRVIERSENTTYTDAEDGSVSRSVIKYEYTYDAEGRVESIKYYSDGEMDHITNITYDEHDNILVYSNVDPDDNSEYLRFEFTYKLVNEDSVTLVETDTFTLCVNCENLVNRVL